MKFPEILPPSDLLKEVEGIEHGLRQRQRLGIIGVLATLLQAVVLIANHDWFQKVVVDKEWKDLFNAHWPSLLMLAGSIFFLLLAGWAKFWLEESQAPFRYTYSIADFKPVLSDKADGPREDRISVQLSHDMAERLSERIKRLSLLDEEEAKPEKAKSPDDQPNAESKRKSHIHIRGFYVIRTKPNGKWFVEVMPRVRIGPTGSPETLAHSVKYRLPRSDEGLPTQLVTANKDKAEPPKTDHESAPTLSTKGEAPPTMNPLQYEQILERVYFSVATEIYKQIQLDVKRKIELLPTNYYRAVALFHEAEDYARSTTLDAYDEALELYGEAIKFFDPSVRPWSKSRWRRAFQRIPRGMNRFGRWLKGLLVHLAPRLGKVELMCARTEIGYANMLLYRQTLAAISLQRVNAVFEAKPVAARAVERLKKLPEDVPRQKKSLFDAYVTLALAWHSLGSDREAEKWLAESRRLDPARTEEDAKYLYVAGEVTSQRTAKLQLFQRAVEIDPRFDVAQFSRAIELEMLWRTRATLERNVAEVVIREYDDVLKTNPGNVGAWSNMGYIRWLLGDAEQAREAFEGGREYKEIKRETFVAELDCGLARVAAEQGDFEAAYRHYESGVSALLAQGVSHNGVGYTGEFYHFSFINQVIMDRFDRYKRAVEYNRSLWMEAGGRDRSFEEVITELKRIESTPQPGMLEKREQAVKALISLFKRAAERMTPAERELLKAWAEKEPVNESVKSFLHDGNLAWFAEELRKRCSVQQDATLFEELQTSLRNPTFARLMSKHLPAQRIRDAVYAFALDDYGTACYKYFSRSGDGSRLTESAAAYREAALLYDEFVMPHYHLYTQIENDEQHIRKVIKLEPNWPDGKLAMIRKLVEQVEEKRRQASNERQVALNKLAEKGELESKIMQAKADHAETKKKRREAESKRKKLERPSFGAESEEAHQSPKKTPVSPLELGRGQDPKAELPTPINEPQQSEPTAKAPPYAAGAAGQAEEEKHKAALAEWERESRRLQSAVTKSNERVNDLDGEAETLEGKVSTEINMHLKTLLPHKWLWCEGKGEAPIFDKKALGRKEFIDELKWEKEFNALHARALLTWTQARDQLLRAKLDIVLRAKQETAKGTTANPKLEKETENAKLEVRNLLDHIARHFWPEDFDLLYTCRRVWKEANKPIEVSEYDRKINAMIRGWLPNEPYTVLWWWVSRDEAFDRDREVVYAEAAKSPSLSGHSYKLLGDKLVEAAKREAENGKEAKTEAQREAAARREAEKREEALAVYRLAMRAGESGPGLRYELASSFEELQRWEESLQLYRQSRENEAGQAEPSHSPRDYCLRIGRNLLALGRTEATSEFEAIGRGERYQSPRWRKDIVSDARTHITCIESYRLLKSWLQSEVDRCRLRSDKQGWQDAQEALLFLAEEKYRDVVPESGTQPAGAAFLGMFPIVTPIALEADATLFPSGEGWEQSHPLLRDYIPWMRDRIEAETGVRVPGVRVRANEGDLPRNCYLIMLNEVPLVMGTVERERKFCPHYSELAKPHGADSSTATLVFNPLTGGKDGAWVEESDLAAINSTDTEVWDHFQYMTNHLEAVLLANLASFFGPQEVSNYLERWQADDADQLQPRQELIQQALPHVTARLRFTQVLQGLLKESVPIIELFTILSAFKAHGTPDRDVTRVIEAVRQEIKAELPGNNPSRHFLFLSAAFEEEMSRWVWERDSKVFFAIPPESAQELLSAARHVVDEQSVIVTQTAGIRPFVRRLMELEFPHVIVLSSSELRPDLHQRVSRTIDYEQSPEKRS